MTVSRRANEGFDLARLPSVKQAYYSSYGHYDAMPPEGIWQDSLRLLLSLLLFGKPWEMASHFAGHI